MVIHHIAMINYTNEKECLPANLKNALHTTSHEQVA